MKNSNKMAKTQKLVLYAYIVMGLVLTSCSSDDSSAEKPTKPDEKAYTFFVSAQGESAEYLLTTDNLNQGDLTIAKNGIELEQSGYTWITNESPSVAIGLIYSKGDPGIGLGYNLNKEGKLNELGQFQITSRFTSYGFFNNQAVTSVGGQTPVDSKGNAMLDENGNRRTDGVTFNLIDINKGLSLREKTITTLDIAHKGEQATLSGIVDIGNGEFLTALVVSEPRDPNASGGSSTGIIKYPDSVWVAKYDANLNLKHIYRDNRISYSAGRFRSQYYSQIGKDDKSNVYVFSGSYEATTKHPAGALKINKGANAFDPAYYFNIQAAANNFRFKNVWHITKDYFLLEFYNKESIETLDPATQYAIVKMEDKTFKWLSGIPAKESIISTGQPASYEGKMYFPITATGQKPTVYIIDPVSATATKGISVDAKTIRAVGKLTKN